MSTLYFMRIVKKYLLRYNDEWFIGYLPVNKPMFSPDINHAKEFFDLSEVEKFKKRLECQCKFTELLEFPACLED